MTQFFIILRKVTEQMFREECNCSIQCRKKFFVAGHDDLPLSIFLASKILSLY